jgi:hypothetical protein
VPNLLPSEGLRGARIGISVSDSPDLDRLGLLEIHFRLALAEIGVLVSGGTLAYGGHLRRDGKRSGFQGEVPGLMEEAR